jgi:hypothetical protein
VTPDQEIQRFITTGDHDVLSILTDAVAARNGWKQILRRCSGQAEP